MTCRFLMVLSNIDDITGAKSNSKNTCGVAPSFKEVSCAGEFDACENWALYKERMAQLALDEKREKLAEEIIEGDYEVMVTKEDGTLTIRLDDYDVILYSDGTWVAL